MLSIRLLLAAALSLAATGCQRAPATHGDSQRGARLIEQYQCGSCHAIPGVRAATGQVGPPLHGFARRAYIAGHLPNTRETLERWIVDPRSLVAATTMPALGAGAADARDMAAYLLTLQ